MTEFKPKEFQPTTEAIREAARKAREAAGEAEALGERNKPPQKSNQSKGVPML